MERDRAALVVNTFSRVAPAGGVGTGPVGIEPVQWPVLAPPSAAAQSPTPQTPATGRSLPLHPRAGTAAVRYLSGNMLMTHPTSPSQSLLHGRLLAFAAILLAALNLRTAVTSLTPLLDVLGQTFGFGTTMTGVLGMLPTAAFALFGVTTPAVARRLGLLPEGLDTTVLDLDTHRKKREKEEG